MNFPQNLKYTNEHEWIRVEGDKKTGITPEMTKTE